MPLYHGNFKMTFEIVVKINKVIFFPLLCQTVDLFLNNLYLALLYKIKSCFIFISKRNTIEWMT